MLTLVIVAVLGSIPVCCGWHWAGVLIALFPALCTGHCQLCRVLGAGWMQPDDIKMPARPAAQTSNTRGLRDKYEQKTLRQKYAADDTNVPEYAVRRVNEYVPALPLFVWLYALVRK